MKKQQRIHNNTNDGVRAKSTLSTYNLLCDDADFYIPEIKQKGRC